MASAFNLTAQLNLKGPTNIGAITSSIKKQLGSFTANVDVKLNQSSIKSVTQLNSGLQQLNKTLSATTVTASSAANALAQLGQTVGAINIKNLPQQLAASSSAISQIGSGSNQATKQIAAATTQMEEFGKQSALAVRRFAAFSIVTSSIYALSDSINKGIAAFIEYDQQFVKLQQITGQSAQGLQSLSKEITSLSVGLGVSSSALTEVASTLAQAGLSAKDTERALKALALSSLAPSFDSMNETVEGSIAIMRQFGISAEGLEGALSSINTVAAKFAVEASDIITAVQRTGGVFATASKGVSEGADALNEFIAVFTSVRATTRESAETIATGLRTIFTRIQRGSTIDALKEFGVNLQDAEGKFVGAYKAVELLSKGLNGLDTRDVKFSEIVEELGGFRQIGKVIPLIQQFSVAQNALKIAQQGQGSLAKDAATAQLSLGNQIQKVRQEFLALFREIGQSQGFQIMVKATLSLASALIKVADASKVLLPALGVLLAFKGASAVTQFASGFGQGLKPGAGKKDKEKPLFAQGGQVRAFARGGVVPGSGDGDTVPAMLTPGEFVIRKKAVQAIGSQNLHRMNKYALGGKVEQKGSDLVQLYSSLRDKVDPKETYKATITPVAIDAGDEGNDRLIANMIKNKRKQNSLLMWKNFEKSLSQTYGLSLATTGNSYLDFPPNISEAKFLQADGGYGQDDEDGPIKGNNNETMLAKLIGQGLYKKRGANRVTDYYTNNPNQIRAIVNRYSMGDALSKNKYGSARLASGGLVQKFLKGGTVEETAEMEKMSLQDAILAQIKELGGIGGVKSLIGASGSDRKLDSLLRANVIKQKDTINPDALNAVNNALKNEEGKKIRRAQQINKSQKLAVVGLQPFDKSDEIPFDIPGFESSTIFVRGLSSKYADAVSGMREMVENTIEKFGTDIQSTMVFGGNAPLALDFDETLVSGADIFGPNGKPDIPAYSDLDKVAKALNGDKVKLTPLGEKIKEIAGFDPSFINRIRVLTARPQSNAGLLSEKLNELGIPLGADKITGVSGGNKGAAMGMTERLIDDNIKNINDAKRAGKSAVQYAELRRLSEEEKAATGNANAEGAILEAALAKMGAVGGNVQNRAVDFENGLGMAAAQAFPGIAPDWPTEVKRTLSSDNIGRAKEEFIRYYAENYGPWPQQEDAFGFDKAGMPVSRFAMGGKASRKVSYEAGVGPSPFSSSISKTLGQSVYGLQNGTGLSDQEFNEIKKTADTYGYNEEEFKQYLAKRIQEKKNKSGLRRDPSELLRDITPQSRTSTARQLALAETLKGPPDAGHRPIPTDAQRIAQARSDISNATRYAEGGVAESEQQKEKQYGQIGLKIGSGRITAEYLRQGMSLLGGGSMRSGEVTADKNGSIYTVQSAGATDGFGPKLYDIVMEAVTANGSMLTSDRHSVSDDAYRVWNYYFKNRGDVKKTPLSPENWYHGQKWFDQSKFPSEDPKTWAPKSDDAWTLLTGYSKAPSLINDPKLVQRLASGGAVQLYHGSNTGVNDSVLKSFQENGALSNIAQGYGQGAGFYLWSDKESAKRQAQMRVKGGLGSFTAVSGDTAGKPMVLTFKEMLDPATWDLDYELNKGPVVNWLYKNYDKIKDKVVPQRANTETASPGLTGIKDIISADSSKGIMSNGIRVQSDSGSRLSVYAGTEANLREGEMLGQIMSRLQSSDPKMVGDFENEFFNSPSLSSGDWTNLALKYVGSSALRPTNIETFAKGGSVEDTVPALLTPGEFVVNKRAAQKIGYSKLHKLNHADKIAGFNKGGVVGGVQTFAAGGTVSFSDIMGKIIDLMKTDSRPGPAPKLVSRPDTPSRATLQISDGVQDSIKEVIRALNDLGVSSSNTADLINKGGDLSYKITEKALAKDIERMTIAGATIDQIAAAEKVLAEVRSESKTKVGQTQKLEDSFRNSSVGQKFGSGGAQQAIILEADKIEKSLQQQNINLIASKLQMPGATPAETQARAKELANDPAEKAKIKERAYLRAAQNVTGVKKSEFTKLEISGGDIQKYISESLKDRKSLANMDKLLIEAKIEELKNTKTYQSALGSEQERMLAEVKKAAEEEASVRREIINDLARDTGGEGVGAAGMTDYRNSPILQALKRNMPKTVGEGIGMATTGGVFASGLIAANGNNIANQLYDTSSNKGALQAAKTGAAISSAGTIASTGFTAAGQSLQVDPSGATAAIIALGTIVVAATDYFYDFTGSQEAATEALEQSIRAKDIAQATSSLELAFRKFENDVGNIDIQKSLNDALSNVVSTSASDTSFNIRKSEEEFNVNNRGYLGFFRQKIFGEKNVVMDARERQALNAQEAERYGQAAELGYKQIGESIKGGASVDQIMKDSNLAAARRAIVMGSAEGVGEYNIKSKERAQELGLSRGEDLSQEEKEAIMDEIAARVVAEDSYITTSVKATKLGLALEAADLAGRRLAQSFDKLFDSINQSINKNNFNIEQRKSATEYAMGALSGNAVSPEYNSRNINILQNPKAYSSEEFQGALNTASQGLSPSDSAMIKGAATIQRDLAPAIEASIRGAITGGPGRAGEASLGIKEAAKIAKDTGNAQIDSLVGVPEELKTTIKQQLDAAINAQAGNKDVQEAFQYDNASAVDKFLATIKEATDKALNNAGKGATDTLIQNETARQQAFNEFTKNLARSSALLKSYNDTLNKAKKVVDDSRLNVRQAITGRSESFSEMKGRLNADTARLTGGLTDPTAIGKQILSLQQRGSTLQSQIKQANDSGQTEKAAKFAQELDKINSQINNSSQALDNMANSGDLAAKALDDIADKKALLQSRTNVTETLLTQSPEEAKKRNDTFLRLQNNANGGLNGAINSREARLAYSEAMRSGKGPQGAYRAANTVLSQQRSETLGMLKNPDFKNMMIMQSMQDQEKALGRKLDPNSKKDQEIYDKQKIEAERQYAEYEYNVKRSMAEETGQSNNPLMKAELKTLKDRASGNFTSGYEMEAARAQKAAELQGQALNAQAVLIDSQRALIDPMKELRASLDGLRTAIAGARGEDAKVESGSAAAAVAAGKGVGVGVAPAGGVAPGTLARGGVVYANKGALINFEPKGTDTVPAMLTPGEFVVNARATQQNLPLLQAINKNKGGVIYASVGGLLEKAKSIWKGVTNVFGLSDSVSDIENKGATPQNIASSATSAANATEAGLELTGRNVPGVSVVANTLDATSNFSNAVLNPDANLAERTGSVLAGTSSVLNAAKSAQDARNLATAATATSSATTGASAYSAAAGPINVGASLILGAAAGLEDERENADIGIPGRIVAGALTGSAGTGGEGLSRDLAENLTSGNTENIQEGLEQQASGLKAGTSLGFLGPAGFAAGYGIGTAAYTAKVANQAVQQAYDNVEAEQLTERLQTNLDRSRGVNGTPVTPLSLSSEPSTAAPSTVTSIINGTTSVNSNQPPKPSPEPSTNDGTLSVNSNQPPKNRLTMSKGGLVYLADGGIATPQQARQARLAQQKANKEAQKDVLRQRRAAYDARKEAQRERTRRLREGYSVSEANRFAAERFPQAYSSSYNEAKRTEQARQEEIQRRRQLIEEEKLRKLDEKTRTEDLTARYDGNRTAVENERLENQINDETINGTSVEGSRSQQMGRAYSNRPKGDAYRDSLSPKDKALLDAELRKRREKQVRERVQKQAEESRVRFEADYAKQQEKEKARVSNLEKARSGQDFTFKTKDGKYNTTGTVVSRNQDGVVIRKPDGTTKLVPLARLDEDTIKAINAQTSYTEQRKREAEAPKVAANKPTVDYVAQEQQRQKDRDQKEADEIAKRREETKKRNADRQVVKDRRKEEIENTRTRLSTLIRTEQQQIDRLEKKKKDSGLFGSLTSFVTGDTTDDQQIRDARQKIAAARVALDSLKDASYLTDMDTYRGIDSVNTPLNAGTINGTEAAGAGQRALDTARGLAGLQKLDVNTFSPADNEPVGPGLFRTDIGAGQRYRQQEEAAINITRDTAIGATLAVAAPVAAPIAAYFAPGAAATTYTGAALSGAASAGAWAFTGSATRNLDQVSSGEKTTQQGVIDTAFDTMTGITLGAGFGMLGRGIAEKLQARALARAAARAARAETEAAVEASRRAFQKQVEKEASDGLLKMRLKAMYNESPDQIAQQIEAIKAAQRLKQSTGAARQARLSGPRALVEDIVAANNAPKAPQVTTSQTSPFASNAPNAFEEAAASRAATRAATSATEAATPKPPVQSADDLLQHNWEFFPPDPLDLPKPAASTASPQASRSWAQFLRSRATFSNLGKGTVLGGIGKGLQYMFSGSEEEKPKPKPRRSLPPRRLSSGGIIYAANGALMSAQAKGTDTVPAMLTPGEFVVNRESTKQYLPLLKSINSGNYASGGLTKYMAQGGVVTPQYKAVGGETSGGSQYSQPPLSTKGSTEDARLDKIEKSMDKFAGIATTFERASENMSNNINQFSQAVTTMPTQMSHSLNAVVNGSISNSTGASTQIVNSRHEAQIVVDQNNQRMDRANEGAFSRSDPTIIRGATGSGGSAHA